MPGPVPAKYVGELVTPSLPIAKGNAGGNIKRIQEWSCHAGYCTGIDGDFGPATEAAIKAFQQENGIGQYDDPTGVVDGQTWNTLILPLQRATALHVQPGDNFGDSVVRCAVAYLREGAREFGGDNRGMWQRHFSRGRENQPWCQDFASTVWADAARALQMTTLPFPLMDNNSVVSSYVPWVANSARQAGQWRPGSVLEHVPKGSMFFLKNSAGEYFHVGLVMADNGITISTIEGNSNNTGSPEGYAVVRHFRPRATCDFGFATAPGGQLNA